MPYGTLADLYARFGEDEINQVADTDRTGTPDPMLVARSLSDATAEIDAALRARYRLPLDPVPGLVTRLCCELAREALYAARVPENVAGSAKWARDILRQLANGAMLLDATLDLVSDAGGVEIVSGRQHSPFASPVAVRGRR